MRTGPVTLQKHGTFSTKLVNWEYTRFRATPRGLSILCGRSEARGPVVVHKYSTKGKLLSSWEVHTCPDGRPRPHSVLEVNIPSQTNGASSMSTQKQILINCTRCFGLILLHDIVTDDKSTEYAVYTDERKKIKPQDICQGPGASILAVNAIPESKSVWQYVWQGEKLEFKKKIPIATDFPPHIIYDERNDLLIVSDFEEKEIWAYKMETHNVAWRFTEKNKSKEIEKVEIMPCAMALDLAGRLYVADGKNKRVLVMDARSGKFQQCLDMSELGTVRDIAWSDQHHLYADQSMLTAVHTNSQGGLSITHFAICPKQ